MTPTAARVTSTTRFHRTTALAAGAFAGLAAAVTFAAPVSASMPPPVGPTATLTSSVSCNGTVKWKLTTARTEGAVGVLSNVKSSILVVSVHGGPVQPGSSPAPQPIPTLPALTTFVDGGKVTGDREVTEDQALHPMAITVELKLTVTWPIGTNGQAAANLRATATAPHCPGPQPSGPVVGPPPIETSFEADPAFPDDEGTPSGSPVPFPVPSVKPSGSPSASASAAPSLTIGPPAIGIGGGGGGTSGGGGLALTGAAAGSLGVGALLLLLVGAALFVITRRRRMKFTA